MNKASYRIPVLFLGLSLLNLASAQAADPLPDDVARYVERREACDHWRGEDGYDAGRAAEILWAVCQSCPGSDDGLARLKKKYSANQAVQRRLADFEPNIEPGSKKERREACRNVPKERPRS